jgi:dienelactone hydrolase
MTEVLLSHHVRGLTPGVREFADRLTAAGHSVHLPDLFEGRVFDSIGSGSGYVQEIGFEEIMVRGRAVAEGLPSDLVYAGISLGVVPAQMLAQTRAGARGALLLEACLPPSEFGGPWPAGVPVQIHGMDADDFFAGEGDLEAARGLVEETPDAELFLYRGDQHLFADSSLPSYDEGAATLLTDRVLAFLPAVG